MSSARGMLRSMLIVGGAQAVNICISLVRMKLVALMVGPAGMGLLGIYTSLQGTAGTLAGLGLGNSGVREIASNRENPAVLARVRTVLFLANFAQGTVAMAIIWLCRERLARWLIGDAVYASEIGLVGIAVLLGLVAASQTALLQGLRRVGDLARVTILSGLAATIVGLPCVWLQGEQGLIWFLIVQPATAVLIAHRFTSMGLDGRRATMGLIDAWHIWKPMAALGSVFMLAALGSAVTLLLVRTLITRELGLQAAGLFSASWAIAMTYVGFLLGAMGTDYYPRLVEVIHNPDAANRLMNDQMQLALSIGGPTLLALIGGAPWFMQLLYSSEFVGAASMLQWQSVGNVLKLASWPLGFALVAAARSRTYLCTELSWNGLFVAFITVGTVDLGLDAAGIGFAAAYLAYFAFLIVSVRRLHHFHFEALSISLLVLHLSLSVIVLILAQSSPITAASISAVLVLVTGIISLRVVLIKIGSKGKVGILMTRMFNALRWPVRSKE